MRSPLSRALSSVAVVGALAVGLAACGASSSGSGGGTSAGGGQIGKKFNLSGAHFTVGSKEFTEERILGYITADALQAAGANVNAQKLTGSNTVRTALTSGRIDMYWEYDGTAWLDYLKHTSPVKSGEPQQYQMTAAEDLAKNHIKWLTPAKFSDAYGVGMRSNAPGALGQISNLSQMAAYIHQHPQQGTFCGASEFLNRSDGLPNLEKTYGFKFASGTIKTVNLSLDYTSVAKGNPCNFAEIFTTDGRIKTLHLKVLTDDKNAFGSYVPALTVRDAVYKKYAKQLSGIAALIAPKLTTSTIIDLNKKVDVDGMTPQAVAKAWLKQNGLIS